MLTYDEMVEKTREFYDELQIDIPDKYVDLAVRSLTMPQYAKEFNDKFHKEIGDHTLHNLKSARDKFYAHIDLDWQKYAKSITFDEFERCIKFLNDLFDYRVFD